MILYTLEFHVTQKKTCQLAPNLILHVKCTLHHNPFGITMTIRKLTDTDLMNKRVIIREDFNVPFQDGKITSDARIRAALPTINYVLDNGARNIILLSHLGRPTEGEFDAELSLAPVAKALADLLHKPVKFIANWIDGIELQPGEIVLCENVRFQKGEKQNDPALAKKMAALGDVFVMDAFATAHRAESSTAGIAVFSSNACAGLLLSAELEALRKTLANPEHPLVAIIGGSKISTKLTVLKTLLNKVNQLIVGGGIANTFLAACGFPIGKSLSEPSLINDAKELLAFAKQNGTEILIPIDVVVAQEVSPVAITKIKNVADVTENEMILDIGPKTAQLYEAVLQTAKTIVWNGPVGVFELEPFTAGTKALAEAIANSKAFSIAGGGDTLAAIEKFAVSEKISYISTGGGAFLEFMEGKTLPAVAALEKA